jgi:hypothetical protein
MLSMAWVGFPTGLWGACKCLTSRLLYVLEQPTPREVELTAEQARSACRWRGLQRTQAAPRVLEDQRRSSPCTLWTTFQLDHLKAKHREVHCTGARVASCFCTLQMRRWWNQQRNKFPSIPVVLKQPTNPSLSESQVHGPRKEPDLYYKSYGGDLIFNWGSHKDKLSQCARHNCYKILPQSTQ